MANYTLRVMLVMVHINWREASLAPSLCVSVGEITSMITLCTILLILSNAICHEVYETIEDDLSNSNTTTTLYPVNRTSAIKEGYLNETIDKAKTEYGKIKTAATVWKIDTAYGQPKTVEDNNSTESKEEPVIEKPDKTIKDFKPSVHLGPFFDTDSLDMHLIKESFGRNFGNPIKRPPIGFNFPKDFKRPASQDFDIKQGWNIAPPITIHAGDLYKFPEPFKESQEPEQGQNYETDFREERPVKVRKKINPWQNILRMMTAFIPVGLIISALTPNVVTVQAGPQSSKRLRRRSDVAQSVLNISEGCRRRLLCEIYNNPYIGKKSKKKSKYCGGIFCEDTSTLVELMTRLMQTNAWPITQTTRGDLIT